MIIPLKEVEDIRKFYRAYIELFRPGLKINSKEADVFAELAFQTWKRKMIPIEDRFKLVFDYDTKVEMRSYLDMSNESFMVNLSNLRKKGYIKNNTISMKWIVEPTDTFDVTFRFKIKPNEGH